MFLSLPFLSISCSSTYNANCNYNTIRKNNFDSDTELNIDYKNDYRNDIRNDKDDLNDNKSDKNSLKNDLNGEVRGRMRRWSSVDCDTMTAQRPPVPYSKRTKASSAAKVVCSGRYLRG